MMALGTTVISTGLTAQVAYGSHLPVILERKAPPAITGENVYVVWTSNKTDMMRCCSEQAPIMAKHLVTKLISATRLMINPQESKLTQTQIV